MSAQFITQMILEYRYWILIPLSFIEGPIVAFVAGTLAAGGVFNMYFLAALFFIRDVGLDAAYYAMGYFGGRTTFTERMLLKLGVTGDHLEKVRELWARRPGTTMLIGKLSYGIASAFIVVAGMVKMPLRIFFTYGALVAILEYGSLLCIGYFFGASFGRSIERAITNIQYVIAFSAAVISVYYLLSWHMRRSLLKEDKRIEDMPV